MKIPSRRSPTASVPDESEPPVGATGDERRASPLEPALRGRATLIARPRPGPRSTTRRMTWRAPSDTASLPAGYALRSRVAAAVAGCSLLLYAGPLHAQQDDPIAYSLELSGTIDAATERWLGQALEDGHRAAALRPQVGEAPGPRPMATQ
jgi:hypothetical protein